MPRIMVMGDSLFKHTGFAVVVKEAVCGLVEAGYDVYHVGFMDSNKREDEVHPFTWIRSLPLDDLCHEYWDMFVRKYRPDLIFIVTDPGNLFKYIGAMAMDPRKFSVKRKSGDWVPPIVTYTPIEGFPIPDEHIKALKLVQLFGGTTILYCQTALDLVRRKAPEFNAEIAWHGADHAPFKRYSPEDRHTLRELIGWDNKFVIMSGGVNKRTKGLPQVIYTAAEMRENGWDEDVLFYVHSNPEYNTMSGYRLKELARDYGVEDMVLFKQPEFIGNDFFRGVERDAGTLEQARQLKGKVPDTPQGRGFLFRQYDFVSILNCADLYLDLSEVEGWGLWPMEAMACGLPLLQVRDYAVRDEIFGDARLTIEPLPQRYWTTWSSGARLVNVDPKRVANIINYLREDAFLLDGMSCKSLEVASQYKWSDFREKIVRVVAETLERDKGA